MKGVERMKKLIFLCVLSIILIASVGFADESASESWTPAMVGGPVAQGSDLIVVRWVGDANVELTYNNQVILLSTYFDRGPDFPRIVKVNEIKKANFVFLGHAHGDHMSDAVRVALQTGASIYGHRTATETAREHGAPGNQLVEVHNGDVLQFNGFTVQAIHVLHSVSPPGVLPPEALPKPKKSQAQIAWEQNTDRVGSRDPSIPTEGVFAYLFTFGKDFRFYFRDSANDTLTDELKEAMEEIGAIDIATIAAPGGPPSYMSEIQLLNPMYFYLNQQYASHEIDQIPAFLAIREKLPGCVTLFLLPKQPFCFNVNTHKIVSDGLVFPPK